MQWSDLVSKWAGSLRLGPLLACSLLACSLLVSCHGSQAMVEVTSSYSEDLEGLKDLRIATQDGGVEIVAEEGRTEIAVEARKRVWASTREAAIEAITSMELSFERPEPGILEIEAKEPKTSYSRWGVTLSIKIPAGLNVDVETTNGSLDVTGTRAAVNLETTNGRITARQINGDAMARTSNGLIRLQEVQGNVDANTRNGRIELGSISGQKISATTSNGSIEAFDVAGDLKLRSNNGKVAVEISELRTGHDVSIETSNGSILLRVPASLDTRLSMRTSRGKIHWSIGESAARDVEQDDHRVSAVFGSGDGRIDLETSNSSIRFETAEN